MLWVTQKFVKYNWILLLLFFLFFWAMTTTSTSVERVDDVPRVVVPKPGRRQRLRHCNCGTALALPRGAQCSAQRKSEIKEKRKNNCNFQLMLIAGNQFRKAKGATASLGLHSAVRCPQSSLCRLQSATGVSVTVTRLNSALLCALKR